MAQRVTEVPELDETAIAQARAWQDRLTKPSGSLGRLEELGIWLAGAQGACPPRPINDARVVIFAGDHGIAAAAGTSAYPSSVTAAMVDNFLAGGAAVNVLARQVGASVRVLDIAVDCEPGRASGYKIRRGTEPFDRADALTEQDVERGLAAGRAVADEEIDGGADLLIAGDMGIGNTTTAAALVARMTGAEPSAMVGRGTGIDDDSWMRKTAAVRDGLFRTRRDAPDPVLALQRFGGADVAAMTGFLARSAARGVPVVLDGIISVTAAMLAERMQPGSRAWWTAGHRSTEPAAQRALQDLQLLPLLDLHLRLGEGTGALLALGLVHSAVAIMRDMATFDSAGVAAALPT